MKTEYIVVVFVNNQISVLNRITSTYLKRGLNIESLNVTESFVKGISTVIITSVTTKESVGRIVNLLENMIDVLYASCYEQNELKQREMLQNAKHIGNRFKSIELNY